MITIRESDYKDILPVASLIREEDLEDIRKGCGLPAVVVLSIGIARSPLCWTVFDGNSPIGVFGCLDSGIEEVGVPWFLNAPFSKKHTRNLVSLAPQYIEIMKKVFPKLQGAYNPLHLNAVRFLKWAGFTITDTPIITDQGHEFKIFHGGIQ